MFIFDLQLILNLHVLDKFATQYTLTNMLHAKDPVDVKLRECFGL